MMKHIVYSKYLLRIPRLYTACNMQAEAVAIFFEASPACSIVEQTGTLDISQRGASTVHFVFLQITLERDLKCLLLVRTQALNSACNMLMEASITRC